MSLKIPHQSHTSLSSYLRIIALLLTSPALRIFLSFILFYRVHWRASETLSKVTPLLIHIYISQRTYAIFVL